MYANAFSAKKLSAYLEFFEHPYNNNDKATKRQLSVCRKCKSVSVIAYDYNLFDQSIHFELRLNRTHVDS